mgnify:CR=1 FL=1
MNLEELKEKREFTMEEGKARNDKGKHIDNSPYNLELSRELQEINEKIFSLLMKTV